MKFPHVWRGRLSGEDVEGEGAEGEDVADFVAEIAIADGFGCDVDERGFLDPILEMQGERRALSGLGCGTNDTAGLPVENLELGLRGVGSRDEDGLRAESAMDDAPTMRVAEGVGDLANEIDADVEGDLAVRLPEVVVQANLVGPRRKRTAGPSSCSV